MDFITDYYIWIIVVVVVILMTIIGYIAEKTNFGKRSASKKGKKVNNEPVQANGKKVESVVESKSQVPQKEELRDEVVELPRDKTKPIVKTPIPAAQTSSTVPVEKKSVVTKTPVVSGQERNMNSYNGMESERRNMDARPQMERYSSVERKEDLNVPFGDQTRELPTRRNDLRSFKEELDASFEDMEPHKIRREPEEDPVLSQRLERSSKKILEEDLNVPFGDDAKLSRGALDFDLPDLDSIKEDVEATSEEDDDIWKF